MRSPLVGTVVAVNVAVGDVVAVGAELLIIESMKMEHPLIAEISCRLTAVRVEVGQTVDVDQVLVECVAVDAQEPIVQVEIDVTTEREDLARLLARQALLHDDARQEAVQKRHAKGQRSARENIADLVDKHSFIEYGGFGVAGQRGRRDLRDRHRGRRGHRRPGGRRRERWRRRRANGARERRRRCAPSRAPRRGRHRDHGQPPRREARRRT